MKINKKIITTACLLLIAFFSLLLTGCGSSSSATTSASSSTWSANLAVSKTGGTTFNGTPYYSSSKLLVSWTAPSQTISSYLLKATDSVQSTVLTQSVAATSATLTVLKSGTTYTISITACLDTTCSQTMTGSASATGATESEYWQVQGTGDSLSAATKPVTDGNTMPYALRFGSGAGSSLEGKLQLYYNPSGQTEKGTKIAITSSAATTSVSSVSSFTAFSGVGLINPSPAATLFGATTATQAVPLTTALGSKLRLFF